MADQKWSEVGNNISKMVQEAIDSQDFSKLSEAIQNTVSTAVDNAVTGAAGSAINGISKGMNAMSDSLNQMARSMTKRQGAALDPQNPWKGNGEFERKVKSRMTGRDVSPGALYATGAKAGGYICTAIGGAGTFGIGTAVLILAVIALTVGVNMTVPIGIMAVPLILSIFLFSRGRASLGRIARFKNYVRMLGNRTCITLKELASGTGRGEAFVLKDVRDMLNRGMFRQGHLDENEKSLFVTDESFLAYNEDKEKAEAAKAAKDKKEREREAAQPDSSVSGEVKRTLSEGQEYIEKIHAANREIQDAEVSRKLDDLEATVAGIFEYVEAHPESAPETKKLMKYYLPTTIKLLDSYRKLDDHPVQGQNISNSRKQIEDTLDTLNQAFARLFDNLYQDTSMDINSDISVLNTMLAQEGLTGKRM